MATVLVETETKLLTGEAFFELGDIGSCELVDGKVVAMTPPGGGHGGLQSRLVVELGIFLRHEKRGHLVSGETGIFTRRNPDKVRGMDIAFISYQRLPGPLPKQYLEVAPELVVEIVSPNDSWSYVRQKIKEYFAIGVERVWIVDPDDQTVLMYRSETTHESLGVGDTLVGEGPLAGFSMPVAAVFGLE
jgi:Uma2 family endonuclease